MSRSDEDRLGDIRAAIQRSLEYREHLDSPGVGGMAYDAVLKILAVIDIAITASEGDEQ